MFCELAAETWAMHRNDCSAELRHLAHLLRVGASTAKDIAELRKVNVTEILNLSHQAEEMADELERIAAAPFPGGDIAGMA